MSTQVPVADSMADSMERVGLAVSVPLPGPGVHSDAMADAMELARDFRADVHHVFAGHMDRGEHAAECLSTS